MNDVHRTGTLPGSNEKRSLTRNMPDALPVRPGLRGSRHLLLDLPIAWRLTLGFLSAALIAAIAAGVIGFQHTASLSRQSDFYQNLVRTNINLTTGENLLQDMTTETQSALTAASGTSPSQETLARDLDAVHRLITRYDTILTQYVAHDLLVQHPDQAALVTEAGHSLQVTQQRTLSDGATQTWQTYRQLQEQVLQDIASGNLLAAQYQQQFQGEPTNADALSALGALIQFNERLGSSVHDAASVEEQYLLISTILGILIAFIGIILVGWLISNTLVRRLIQLQRVTQAVEQGELTSRVIVIGRDEISTVSASVNAMLEAIGRLLEETRAQRDALANAAEHLFSDMRVVSAGDLRINAQVNNDPIGMLANAFNFTVGRFRRFVSRTQITTEQLTVISQQQLERAESFHHLIQSYETMSATKEPTPLTGKPSRPDSGELAPVQDLADNGIALAAQLRRTRDVLHHRITPLPTVQIGAILAILEQASSVLQRHGRRISTEEEAVVFETLLLRVIEALQKLQPDLAESSTELEQELGQLSTLLRQFQAALSAPSVTSASVKQMQEVLRVGQAFAQDVIAQARRLTTIIKETRNNIEAFQLDAPEPSGQSGSDLSSHLKTGQRDMGKERPQRTPRRMATP